MKKIFKLLTMFFLVCSIVIPTITYADLARVNDFASILSSDEKNNLEEKIKEIGDKYKYDIVILTTNNTEGKSSQNYADDFYDYNEFGYDEKNSGLLLLINMEDRFINIYTTGDAIKKFSREKIDKIIDDMYDEISGGSYYEASEIFLDKVESTLGWIKYKKIRVLAIAVVIALVISSLSCFGISYKYTHSNSVSGMNYLKNNSVKFIARRDQFITSHVTRTKIEKNNGGGGSGGSGVHTSSSGTSHGSGSGRHF